MYMFSPAELAPNEDQGVVFGAVDMPPNATLEQMVPYTEAVNGYFESTPEFDHSFQVTLPGQGFRRDAGQALDGAQAEHFPIQGSSSSNSPGSAAYVRPVFLPPRFRARVSCRRVSSSRPTASHEEMVRFAQKLVEEAVKSGQFAFHRSPTFASIRRNRDRHRPRQGRVDGTSACSRSAPTCRRMLGGNFVTGSTSKAEATRSFRRSSARGGSPSTS